MSVLKIFIFYVNYYYFFWLLIEFSYEIDYDYGFDYDIFLMLYVKYNLVVIRSFFVVFLFLDVVMMVVEKEK